MLLAEVARCLALGYAAAAAVAALAWWLTGRYRGSWRWPRFSGPWRCGKS